MKKLTYNGILLLTLMLFVMSCQDDASQTDGDFDNLDSEINSENDSSDSDAGSSLYIAPGCETFMKGGDSPLGKASAANEEERERLLVAKSNPTWLFSYHMSLKHFNNEKDTEQRNICIMAALEATGFENDDLMRGIEFIYLQNTTFEKVEPFLRLQIVERVSVSCINQTYCDCSDLTLDACEEHAFCTKLYGNPYDAVQECFGDKVAAGCITTSTGCIADTIMAEGPDGICWWFSAGCLPENDGWGQNNDAACDGLNDQDVCDWQ